MRWNPAYVGIGSNLQQPAKQVHRAFAALATIPLTRLEISSSLYGSEPLVPAQPQFVNAVAGLLTQLEVLPFFEALRGLEVLLGRQPPPRERWGPRLIDLDLLLFGQLRLDGSELTLPHPGIVQRNFVLYPLCEVAPDLNVPGCGRVAALAAGVQSAGVWRLNDETTI
jgi:2-amino-4-hydroxy-6-hydroxymethyldihydropteridine diphosphokinase